MNDLSKAASQFHAVPQVKLKLICAITALIIFVIDLMLPLGVAGGVPYVLVILFALWSDNKWFSIMLAVICTALTMAGYYFSPEGSELWKVI
ncbi:MAG: hypothetical protein EP315_02335, partial [Gammaproteobacteria bacterium]